MYEFLMNYSIICKVIKQNVHNTIYLIYLIIFQSTSAPLHKSSRYSSKYRSSGSSRSVPRTSTAPPAYIPTIPSVRSYSSQVGNIFIWFTKNQYEYSKTFSNIKTFFIHHLDLHAKWNGASFVSTLYIIFYSLKYLLRPDLRLVLEFIQMVW